MIRNYLNKLLRPQEKQVRDRAISLAKLKGLTSEVSLARDSEQLATTLGEFRSVLCDLGSFPELERRSWELLRLFGWYTPFRRAHRDALLWLGAAAGKDGRFDELIEVMEENPLVFGLATGRRLLQQAQPCVLKGLPPDFYQAMANWQRAWSELPEYAFSAAWEGCCYLHFLPWLGEETRWPRRLAGKCDPQSDAAFLTSWLRRCSITSLLDGRLEQLAAACSSLYCSVAGPSIPEGFGYYDLDLMIGCPRPRKASRSERQKPRKGTRRDVARPKLIAALTKHHQYENGSVMNLEPIGNNALAALAGVDKSTASTFFQKNFGSYDQYRDTCRSSPALACKLAALNGESNAKAYRDLLKILKSHRL